MSDSTSPAKIFSSVDLPAVGDESDARTLIDLNERSRNGGRGLKALVMFCALSSGGIVGQNQIT